MIKVKRIARPQILRRKARQWTRTLLAASTKTEITNAKNKYCHKEIRTALETMFHGKCAYCESQIKHVSYPHIEHYRPKMHFRGYTFVWHNLLLACGVCNGAAYKGDKFPGHEEGGPLLNPCRDRPEEHLRFHFDPKAKIASVYGTSERGKTTVDCLGLNRNELRKYRSDKIRKLACIQIFATQGDPEAQKLFAEAQQSDSEYTAFARALTKTRPGVVKSRDFQ